MGAIGYTPGNVSSAVGDTTNYMTVLTDDAAVNVKTSYTTVVSSTPHYFRSLHVFLRVTTLPSTFLVDIAIGSAGNEKVIIPNIALSRLDYAQDFHAFFPVSIPAGTRISARFQQSETGGAVRILLVGGTGSYEGESCNKVTTYGVNLGTSRGTLVDPGDNIHTKGSIAQITSSSEVVKFLYINIIYRPVLTAGQYQYGFIDVMVGSSGNEKVILPNVWMSSIEEGQAYSDQILGPYPVDIPAGSRLSARVQGLSNLADQREVNISLIGVS